MSYDISLYRRDFLKRAMESGLGDWTDADPIPDDTIPALIAAIEAAGFVRFAGHKPYSKEGWGPWIEFTLDTPTMVAQVTVFPGEIGFNIPYGDLAGPSIEFCIQMASRLAIEHGLGFYDPQIPEAKYV